MLTPWPLAGNAVTYLGSRLGLRPRSWNCRLPQALDVDAARKLPFDRCNDPVIFLEYFVDVARAAHQRGIKNVAVTAGYIDAAAREELFSFMDVGDDAVGA